MKLASLVISVELAESLYDFGIRNESVLYWYQDKFTPQPELFASGQSQKTMTWKTHIGRPSKESKAVFKEFSAYTCSELGDILPGFIKKDGITYFLRFYKGEKEWSYLYEDKDFNYIVRVVGKTEQDARAALLVFILWNKIIDVSQTIVK